ncbi:Insect cuticle protein [Trinorchestia longiramus]|nr:Insect cuticle protein [Trinorchestia longiramus]
MQYNDSKPERGHYTSRNINKQRSRMKSLLIAAVLGAVAVTSTPETGYHQPKHAYKPPAKPYNFAYGVQDPYKGIDFGQHEQSDGNKVQGSYTVQLPDGRKQIVKYIADHDRGFHADVTYEGKAQYPPKSDHPPFIVPPQKGYSKHPKPSYQPPHQPSYQPPHQPSYQPPHQPSYQPPHEPSYQPPHEPSYQPPHEPSYH